MKIKSLVLFPFLVCSFLIKAQSLTNARIESTIILVSETKVGTSINFKSQKAVLFLNLSTGDFSLMVDLAKLHCDTKQFDTLINPLVEQIMTFKGNISDNISTFNQKENDEKEYPLQGFLTFNGITFPCVALYDPISLAEKSDVKNYRMDIKIVLDAAKITIKGLESVFSNQLVFEVSSGTVNLQ